MNETTYTLLIIGLSIYIGWSARGLVDSLDAAILEVPVPSEDGGE